MKKIRSALISVFHKEGLDEIITKLHAEGVIIYSTGGTSEYIKKLGAQVTAVESLTDFPAIFGGRVKTLHPRIFGGILYRRDHAEDIEQASHHHIPNIDLVIVDLYPFENTVASGAGREEVVEKIDIGGISLIRAAAKNYRDVMIVPSSEYYKEFYDIIQQNGMNTTEAQRAYFATLAFSVSSHYDTCIFNYFNRDFNLPHFRKSIDDEHALRYGENPHQKAYFHGNMNEVFDKLNGKEISYNNLLDIDAALNLMADFKEPSIAILKHNNACGLACRENLCEAWELALSADPLSAFGGIIICNRTVHKALATEMHKLFFEVLIAPEFEEGVADFLAQKKNRILLKQKMFSFPEQQYRTLLNGAVWQQKDSRTETSGDMKVVTLKSPGISETEDLIFANIIVKHTKSNTIVLAKNKQLLGSGTGQTSRVDALKQAIAKAKEFGKDLSGAVMASDAFFPFPDCVEIAGKEGITAVIQPGGSVKDSDSIEYCNKNGIAMVHTGIRHFKH